MLDSIIVNILKIVRPTSLATDLYLSLSLSLSLNLLFSPLSNYVTSSLSLSSSPLFLLFSSLLDGKKRKKEMGKICRNKEEEEKGHGWDCLSHSHQRN